MIRRGIRWVDCGGGGGVDVMVGFWLMLVVLVCRGTQRGRWAVLKTDWLITK